MKRLLHINVTLLLLVSCCAHADSGNKIEIEFTKDAKITDFEFIEGSDVTKKGVSFKDTKHSISKNKIEINAILSSRSGANNVRYVKDRGGRFNLSVGDTIHGACVDSCNFLFNAEMSINGKKVPWDFVFGQGHNSLQSRNYWFVGFQQKGHSYGGNAYHKGCKSFNFDGSTYTFCAKGANKFKLSKKS